MTKLRISVWVILTFLGLAVALQAVVLFVEQLRHFYVADRVLLPAEFFGHSPRAFADPPQRRFRITTSSGLNQALHRFQKCRISHGQTLAPCSRATNAPFRRAVSLLDFANTFSDRLAGQPTGTANH